MDSRDDLSFQPSSPHSSSGEADSYNGTPDTRLTAFSPNDGCSKSAEFSKRTDFTGRETTPVRFPLSSCRGTARGDPFLAHAPLKKAAQKLSPTASAFRPFPSALVAVHGTGSSISTSPTSSAHLPIASHSFSSETGISRTLIVSSGMRRAALSDVNFWLQGLEQLGCCFFSGRASQTWKDHVVVRFSDIRDSSLVYSRSCTEGCAWEIKYAPSCGVSKMGTLEPELPLDTGGQVMFSAFTTSTPNIEESAVERLIRQLLLSHGDVFALRKQPALGGALYSVVVEFCDESAARSAVSRFANLTIEGVLINVSASSHMVTTMPQADHGGYSNNEHAAQMDKTLARTMQGMSLSKPMNSLTPPGQGTAASGPRMNQCPTPAGYQLHPQVAMYPIVSPPQLPVSMPYLLGQDLSSVSRAAGSLGNLSLPVSPGTRGFPPPHPYDFHIHGRGSVYARSDTRRQNTGKGSRGPYSGTASHHNHVDVDRIRGGIDVRTTIMLRNIPNKVDQAMLKRIVDESSWGKYDFMYLRIDFANDCNVGYAFINFVDPLDIIDFVNARGNQRWNCFKSDKVAEISYATIQGKDCLVQKFRNSSVMLEAAHYRPKLYFTLNGPNPDLAGQEEPFPEPDNQSKMKRSCENAEHVGLFTPNAGQHFRDEQRRRRSQYDRGTRMAALEEYNYDTAIDQVYAQR